LTGDPEVDAAIRQMEGGPQRMELPDLPGTVKPAEQAVNTLQKAMDEGVEAATDPAPSYRKRKPSSSVGS
jgi:hypothetical protein